MSPEQARGEGHRLDGRSDIFSLGIVFYEALTGKRPFRGSTANELFHQVISEEPPRPRELDESIPIELERICLKALSKRASERYSTAAEFVDDLLHWQEVSEQPSEEHQVRFHGLRSFDADDADFFLDLLPGPRNRNGLPESIQFWKTRIEETDPEETFPVGLIYGPSGCGKSSLVKAGLLSRYAWYDNNSEWHMWSVGVKLPNRYGAFDMHGNAYEWCHNLHYLEPGQYDNEVKTAHHRVLRGGAFSDRPVLVRSAERFNLRPVSRGGLSGFRPARTMSEE